MKRTLDRREGGEEAADQSDREADDICQPAAEECMPHRGCGEEVLESVLGQGMGGAAHGPPSVPRAVKPRFFLLDKTGYGNGKYKKKKTEKRK